MESARVMGLALRVGVRAAYGLRGCVEAEVVVVVVVVWGGWGARGRQEGRGASGRVAAEEGAEQPLHHLLTA